MLGPGDMNRPPFEGGHPGMRGPRGPEYPVDPWELGGMMGDPRPNIKSSFSIGKVYMTPNGPMRMAFMGPIPIGPDGRLPY